MIREFQIYGEVVSFDTTYRTNKEYRPLTLFVGLNNHREMIVFGAALLYEEITRAFEWLFNVFFRVMSSDKLQTFITDKDPAINLAVSLVMPQTYHRLCIWHLEQNVYKHLGHIFRAHKFQSDFSKLLFDYEYEAVFLNAWEEMLEKYDLKDNSWLKNTFTLRKKKWSMTYGRDTFSVGMRSTQLSESFNGSLKAYLKSDLDIVQFFKHFERAVDDNRANEGKSKYTATIFDLFEKQWEKSLLVSVNNFCDEGDCYKYNVRTHESDREHTVAMNQSTHTVAMNHSTKIVSCSCKLFEFSGILCGHALKILDILNVKDKIFDYYIVKRWTKDATNLMAMKIKGSTEGSDPKAEVSTRYKYLCKNFIQIASEASEFREI
ncbi:protein FAR1-RELATED SEQUENCE 5-like isoform X1 [Capsicum chacoense]